MSMRLGGKTKSGPLPYKSLADISCPTARTTRNSATLANTLPRVVMMNAAGTDQLSPTAAMTIATSIPWEGKAGMKRSAIPAANKPSTP